MSYVYIHHKPKGQGAEALAIYENRTAHEAAELAVSDHRDMLADGDLLVAVTTSGFVGPESKDHSTVWVFGVAVGGVHLVEEERL